MFSKYMSDNGFVPRIYTEYLISITSIETTQLTNGQRFRHILIQKTHTNGKVNIAKDAHYH